MVLLQSAHPLLGLVAGGKLSPFCFKSHSHCVHFFLIEKLIYVQMYPLLIVLA